MTKLEQLYSLRARVDAEIDAEITRLDKARKAVQLKRRARRSKAVCGTDGGYFRHIRRLKEPACDSCKRAHAKANRLSDRARRRRARQEVAA